MLLQRDYLNKKLGKKKKFILFLLFAFLAVGLCYANAFLASWLGFCLAAYTVIANDAIQTIGTFIASNKNKPWWLLWAFASLLFVGTTFYSWYTYGGDVSYQRLAAKGFSETPETFTMLQVAAPIFLLILTRLKMPVSTTFLILSCFATTATSIEGVMIKSFMGYGVAFVTALILWLGVSKLFKLKKLDKHTKDTPLWTVLQWFSTGSLWCIWLMQDAANIAVFLPRSLSLIEYCAFAIVPILSLGWIFFNKGEKIQAVVDEKSGVEHRKSATVIDFIYAIILYIFKIQSQLPMSTTWVFVGLLAGREIGKSLSNTNEKRDLKKAGLMALKDLGYVTIGLIISLVLALITNDAFRQAWLGW